MKDEIKEILEDLKKYVSEGGEHTLMEYEIKHIQCYITNLQEENQKLNKEKNVLLENLCMSKQKYNNDKVRYRRKAKVYKEELDKIKSKNEKTNTLLDEMLERAYIDGEYIMYDYSISEWELKDFTDKLKELKGSDDNE